MAVGYDVCHDPSSKSRSYGAMVATLDRSCVRWYSNVTRHSAGEELSVNFASNMLSTLNVRLLVRSNFGRRLQKQYFVCRSDRTL